MPELSIQVNSIAPDELELVDIVKVYDNNTGTEFLTRFTNINELLNNNKPNTIQSIITADNPAEATEFDVDNSVDFYFINCENNDITANYDLSVYGSRKTTFIRIDTSQFRFYINDLEGVFTVSGNPVPFDTIGYYSLDIVSDGTNLYIY